MKQTGLTLLVILLITAIVSIPSYAEAGRKEDNLWFGLGGLAIGTTVGYVIGSQTRKPPRQRHPAPVYYDGYYSPAYYGYSSGPFYQPPPISHSHRGQAVSMANMGGLNLSSSQDTQPEPQPQNITISIGDNASNVSINLGKDGQVTENSQPVSASREGRTLRRPENNTQPVASPATETRKEAEKEVEKDESDSDDQE